MRIADKDVGIEMWSEIRHLREAALTKEVAKRHDIHVRRLVETNSTLRQEAMAEEIDLRRRGRLPLDDRRLPPRRDFR